MDLMLEALPILHLGYVRESLTPGQPNVVFYGMFGRPMQGTNYTSESEKKKKTLALLSHVCSCAVDVATAWE